PQKFCPQCGARIASSTLSRSGSPVQVLDPPSFGATALTGEQAMPEKTLAPVLPSPVATPELSCPHCGHISAAGRRYCVTCGRALQAAVMASASEIAASASARVVREAATQARELPTARVVPRPQEAVGKITGVQAPTVASSVKSRRYKPFT